MSNAEFNEEDPPIPVAESFGLMDFDSQDLASANFTVVVTLTEASDTRQYEGLLFDTAGTDVWVEVSEPGPFSITYTLQGSDRYSIYQTVSAHSPRPTRHLNNG